MIEKDGEMQDEREKVKQRTNYAIHFTREELRSMTRKSLKTENKKITTSK